MSIEEKDKVDFINTSNEDNDLVLLGITDYLSWKKTSMNIYFCSKKK